MDEGGAIRRAGQLQNVSVVDDDGRRGIYAAWQGGHLWGVSGSAVRSKAEEH